MKYLVSAVKIYIKVIARRGFHMCAETKSTGLLIMCCLCENISTICTAVYRNRRDRLTFPPIQLRINASLL